MDQQLDVDDGPQKADEDERPSLRERWLKLALLTIAAGLAATIVSLLTQSDDETENDTEPAVSTSPADEPSTGAATSALTASPQSGTVTVDIEVLTDNGGQAAEVRNRFNGADYDATVSFLGDPESYSGSPIVQELRYVDGTYHYRSTESDGWEPAEDPSVLLLDEGVLLPASVVGWSTAGVAELVATAGLGGAADGEPTTATITVAQARALGELPAGLATVVGSNWGWSDDQPVAVTATFTEGQIVELDVVASDDEVERVGGPLTVAARTAYIDLDTPIVIEAP